MLLALAQWKAFKVKLLKGKRPKFLFSQVAVNLPLLSSMVVFLRGESVTAAVVGK